MRRKEGWFLLRSGVLRQAARPRAGPDLGRGDRIWPIIPQNRFCSPHHPRSPGERRWVPASARPAVSRPGRGRWRPRAPSPTRPRSVPTGLSRQGCPGPRVPLQRGRARGQGLGHPPRQRGAAVMQKTALCNLLFNSEEYI